METKDIGTVVHRECLDVVTECLEVALAGRHLVVTLKIKLVSRLQHTWIVKFCQHGLDAPLVKKVSDTSTVTIHSSHVLESVVRDEGLLDQEHFEEEESRLQIRVVELVWNVPT
jgi:hypothetical protein